MWDISWQVRWNSPATEEVLTGSMAAIEALKTACSARAPRKVVLRKRSRIGSYATSDLDNLVSAWQDVTSPEDMKGAILEAGMSGKGLISFSLQEAYSQGEPDLRVGGHIRVRDLDQQQYEDLCDTTVAMMIELVRCGDPVMAYGLTLDGRSAAPSAGYVTNPALPPYVPGYPWLLLLTTVHVEHLGGLTKLKRTYPGELIAAGPEGPWVARMGRTPPTDPLTLEAARTALGPSLLRTQSSERDARAKLGAFGMEYLTDWLAPADLALLRQWENE